VNIELIETAPHITTIRLNRPERLNALNFGLVADLHTALDTVAGNPDCKVAILTGAGRGFCAGLDLRDWGALPDPGGHPHYSAGSSGQSFISNMMTHIRATPQIVIAAVNGPAFGGGLSLAAACDLRIAASSARFCSAFIRTGLSGADAGITYLLPRLIGAAKAFDLIVTGRTIDADEADRMGLVSRVVADEELMASVLDTATSISQYTTFGLQNTKEVMWHNLDTPSMAAAIAMENRTQMLASSTPEVADYMASYSSRHRPS
jgi:enoyl-CoA hydratase